MSESGKPKVYCHKKTGNLYGLQLVALLESDGVTPMAVYYRHNPPTIGASRYWVRPAAEFWEKFEEIADE